MFLFAPVGGPAIELPFTQDDAGLLVTLPAQPYTAIAYAMKISKSGTVPAPTPTIVAPPPDGGTGGSPDGGGDGTPDGASDGPGGSGGVGTGGGCGCAVAKSGSHSSSYALLAAALAALVWRGRRKRSR